MSKYSNKAKEFFFTSNLIRFYKRKRFDKVGYEKYINSIILMKETYEEKVAILVKEGLVIASLQGRGNESDKFYSKEDLDTFLKEYPLLDRFVLSGIGSWIAQIRNTLEYIKNSGANILDKDKILEVLDQD